MLRSFNVGYPCLAWSDLFDLIIIYVCAHIFSTFKIGLYIEKCAFKSLSVIFV